LVALDPSKTSRATADAHIIMVVINDEYERLSAIIDELSVQLSANRAHCAALKRQADDLKTQAVHTGTGFTLRRFNVDISKELFESEIERLNATLVLENHALQHENRQLSMLLKDHENALEIVMDRFRGFAHATQQHELDVARHYENLLLDMPAPTSPSGSLGEDNSWVNPIEAVTTVPVADLDRLAGLVRKAMRSLQGDDPSPPASDDGQDTDGGYLTLLGGPPKDNYANLVEDIEAERLRTENAYLRQLLGLTADEQVSPKSSDV